MPHSCYKFSSFHGGCWSKDNLLFLDTVQDCWLTPTVHSCNFVCELTVLIGVKIQKTIYVFISVKCLIIGFILCRIKNNINKDDDYEVEDKNNYNNKNNLLRLMLFFKQQTTGLNTYLWVNEGTLSADIFTSLHALSCVFFLSHSLRWQYLHQTLQIIHTHMKG